MNVAPVTLTGPLVILEPLAEAHTDRLALAGADESIWRHLPYGSPSDPGHFRAFVRACLDAQAAGTELPFAVIHRPTGTLAGCTRYLDIRQAHRGLEIGGTWYAPAFQRTGVNTEAKRLLLTHAFETLGCIRVQLKTDLRNERSQRAIERLGASREGVLRKHMILPDGHQRSTVMYSITDDEWPGVRARLAALADRHAR